MPKPALAVLGLGAAATAFAVFVLPRIAGAGADRLVSFWLPTAVGAPAYPALRRSLD